MNLDSGLYVNSKLIANNAFELSDLINNNTALDTSTNAMELFSRADLLNYQRKTDLALAAFDSILTMFPEHTLVDEVYFRKAKIFIQKKVGIRHFQTCLKGMDIE